MQNKETFGLNNMNGLTENDRRSCALDDMNCLAGQEEKKTSLQDMNGVSKEKKTRCGLDNMNCRDD